MPGLAEQVEILLAVAEDLTERTYKLRKELVAADLASFFLTDRVAKRLVDKFPTLSDALKEKDAGYETFVSNAHLIVDNFQPFFATLCQLLEWKDHALRLLTEMSNPTVVLNFSLEVNEVLFSGYYNLMLHYAKLHLLVATLASPSGRGKLALAAYSKAHTVRNSGSAPPEYEALAKYLIDYESPLPRMQDDLTRAKLRVADTLLPLGMQMIRLCDHGYLRGETVLSPLHAPAKKAGELEPALVDPLLARLPEAKQWLLFGLLLYPDDLAEAGAVDLLIALLNVTYVLPIYGNDVLYPHAEFEVDFKTVFRWIKKKDEAKRFLSLVKESRITAFRQAGQVHATTRAVLITKLSRLHCAFLDSPSLISPRFQVLLAGLKLAQDEITWWALHADAVPDDLPRKEREAERDMTCFHPASVQALLRHTAALSSCVLAQKALLTEASAARMGLYSEQISECVKQVAAEITLPTPVSKLLAELPAHIAHAGDVGCDLRGLRLNVLRLVCTFSTPQLMALVTSNKSLARLVHELHATVYLSLAIDATERQLRSATAPTALFADPSKLDRIFMCALDTKPPDCLVLLELAADASVASATSPLPSMLQRMAERIHALLLELAEHFRAQRSNPHGVASVLDVIQKACTLCKALDRARSITYTLPGGQQPVTISLQAWLREQFETFVHRHMRWIIFPSSSSIEPRTPTAALSLLADLSHALAVLEPYIHLDAHAMLNAVVVRELGALESAGPDVVSNELPQAAPNVAETAAVRAEGPIIDAAAAQRAKALAGGDGTEGGAPPTLITRLKLWMRKLTESAQRPDGPQYMPGRRAFSNSALDSIQMCALSRLVGSCGMQQLEQVLLDLAAEAPLAVGSVLRQHQEPLAALAVTFERTRRLDPACTELPDLNVLLASCRALGIVLVARSILQEGVRAARAVLLPPAVPSFVGGLGAQQLPDGQRAGMVLPPVTDLLASFGQIRGADMDAPLAQLLADRAGIPPEDSTAWASLPYALALMLTLPEWAMVMPNLAEDGVSGNVHCIVHAVHALLCMAEPHMHNANVLVPAEAAAIASGRFAHRRFLEVASLVLLQQRQMLFSGHVKPQEVSTRERCMASIVLVVEQLVQLASALGYGDLQTFLPYTLVLSNYTAVSQPVSVPMKHEAALVSGPTPVDVSDRVGGGGRSSVPAGGFQSFRATNTQVSGRL